MEFRKKPVVIEAIQWPGDRFETAPPEWFTKAMYAEPGTPGFLMRIDNRLVIETLEGQVWAQPGDWIIRGVKGELYPCKPDIFAATYEEASAPSSATTAGERQSIDTPEFRALLRAHQRAAEARCNSDSIDAVQAERSARVALIAHIDTWAARSAGDAVEDARRYRHIRDTANNGYDLRGPAGIDKWHVSRKVREGEGEYLWGRYLDNAIDQSIAAAPAPGNTTQPTAYDTMDHDQLSKLGQQQKGEHDGR
jgi:hypothetical protein